MGAACAIGTDPMMKPAAKTANAVRTMHNSLS
jgi:hypothetical protein